MAGDLRTGTVRVRVPATSANLGPGYDSFGLALARYDEVEVDVAASAAPLRIDVSGEGAGDVPRDASHLVVRSMLAGLDAWGAPRPVALHLRCANAIPHGRGLGSSAAAIVAGLLAARAVVDDPDRVADDEVLALAGDLEGHPDNVAACLSGGFTVSWSSGDRARSVRLTPDARIQPVVCVPGWSMSTEEARGLLPQQVPHADAAFTASRAALLVAAVSERPDLLLEATEDRLHQPYRAAAMVPSAELMADLRSADVPAVISGAGPTVLALTMPGAQEPDRVKTRIQEIAGPAWTVQPLAVDSRGAAAEYLDRQTRFAL